jgi:hypothetical protein
MPHAPPRTVSGVARIGHSCEGALWGVLPSSSGVKDNTCLERVRTRLPACLLPGSGSASIRIALRTATSFYNKSDLNHTLERLVDFDQLHAGMTRLSIGAVIRIPHHQPLRVSPKPN